MASLMADVTGADPSQVASLMDLYEAELHHDSYDPSFIARKRAEIQARTAAVRQKAAAAKKKATDAAAAVSAMTVTEEDLKPIGS